METKNVDSEEDVDIDGDCFENDTELISGRRSRILAAQILDMKCSAGDELTNDGCPAIDELTIADGIDFKFRLDSRQEEASTDILMIDAAIESLRMWRIAREVRAKEEANGIYFIDDAQNESTSSDFPETTDASEGLIGGFHARDVQTTEAQIRRLSAQQSESESAISTIHSITMLANIRHQNRSQFEQPKSQETLHKIIEELEVMQQGVNFKQVEDFIRLENRRNSTIERLEQTVIDEGLDLQMNVASLQANLEAFENDLAFLLK